MRNLVNFLKIDGDMISRLLDEEYEYRLQTRIVEVAENRFHFQRPRQSEVRHFRMDLYAEVREVGSQGDLGWRAPDERSLWDRTMERSSIIEPPYDSIIPFYLSAVRAPSEKTFFDHIYKECFAALFSVFRPGRHKFRFDLTSPEMEDVFVYLKLLHEEYEQSRDFIRDYDFWSDRLWQTQKWFHYLLGNIQQCTCSPYERFSYPVGQKLLAWISPNDYPKSVGEIRRTLGNAGSDALK
jgi:hypothetical protein